MLHRTTARTLIGAAAIALSVTAVPAAANAAPAPAAAPAAHRTLAAVTLYYDDSQAAEFKDAVVAGAEVWNANVQNVHLVEATGGQSADIDVVAYDGWPESTLGPVFPGGHGTVYYGREAVNEGYDLTRIAAHELGHSLGLDDNKPGPCSSLMSGSTGGVDCKNSTPNAEEIAGVEANYASGAAAAQHLFSGRTLIDAP
jgi:snapalysin